MVMERDGLGVMEKDGWREEGGEGGCWLSCPAGAGAHSNKMEITAASEPLRTVSVTSSPSFMHIRPIRGRTFVFIHIILG